MATAKKLPSGSWRIRVTDSETGKRVSFTADTKNEAELMALEFLNGKRKKPTAERTIGEYIDEYISSKSNVLSPSTLSSYRCARKNWLDGICHLHPSELTQNGVQRYFNALALKVSAKSVKNAHGLFMSVLNIYFPDVRLRTTLPKVQKKIKQLPNAEDVLRAVKDTEIELPCLLACWLGLRMSEIRGARKSDINDGVLTIQNTITTVDRIDIERKATKTYDSTRQIVLPPYIMHLIASLPDEQLYLTTLSRDAIYKRFKRIIRNAKLEDMTFHDLRHLNASTMLALGVPDKYAMERGGWSSTAVIKSVYQHTLTSERKKFDRVVDDYFGDIIDRMDTNSDTK